jgi:methylated-DNA-[protein]-cysteine S-methyltransferase
LLVGSDFQKRVWQALQQVPFGSVSSYRQLAESIGNPKAVRAVANANGANAISIIIPCHRIIGSNGRLVGYAGGLKAKAALLKLEHNLFTQ